MIVGDLRFDVVDIQHYCRYCEQYSKYCREQHRSGIWFLVRATNTKTKATTYFVIGEGEAEEKIKHASYGELKYYGMSGCSDYENAYITCGGWHSIKSPVFAIETPEYKLKSLKPIKLTTFKRVILAELLDSEKPQILIELLKQGIIDFQTDLGVWEAIKPLLITWESEKTIDLPLGAWLSWKGKSWLADFHFGLITIHTIKAKPKVTEIDGIYYIHLGRKTIAYAEIFGRKIAYYKYYPYGELVGFEEYQGYYHQPCRIRLIDLDNIHHYMKLLFFRRLGDLLFLTNDDLEFLEEEYVTISPAEKQHFNKIKCIQGCIEFNKPIRIFSDDKIVLYHKEHGLLELPKGEYIAYQVPYRVRGHE